MLTNIRMTHICYSTDQRDLLGMSFFQVLIKVSIKINYFIEQVHGTDKLITRHVYKVFKHQTL